MDWPEAVREAVSYIEKHITEDITMYDVADYVHVSPFYFHKGFCILCGYSITEYIRNRRLALAGQELLAEDVTVLAVSKEFDYQNAKQDIPSFWQEHYASGNGEHVCGMFGININPRMSNERFEYLIAPESISFSENYEVISAENGERILS